MARPITFLLMLLLVNGFAVASPAGLMTNPIAEIGLSYE